VHIKTGPSKQAHVIERSLRIEEMRLLMSDRVFIDRGYLEKRVAAKVSISREPNEPAGDQSSAILERS
jgi:hypothetical protein